MTGLALKIVGPIVVFIALYYALMGIYANFAHNLLQNAHELDAQRHAIQPAPYHSIATRQAAYASRGVAIANPAAKAPVSAESPAMTAMDLKEWGRKNAESMRILEKTTPELGAAPVSSD